MNNQSTRRGSSSEKGSSLVEGALVMALFMLVVYGFVQIALVLFGYNNLTYASRVAMRYAVVHGSSATYTCTSTDIKNMITPLLWGAPSATVQTNWSPNNSPGSSVTISVTVQYHPVIPFMPAQTFTVGTTAYGTIIQ